MRRKYRPYLKVLPNIQEINKRTWKNRIPKRYLTDNEYFEMKKHGTFKHIRTDGYVDDKALWNSRLRLVWEYSKDLEYYYWPIIGEPNDKANSETTKD
jgi:hypothetical protein